jgi:hypothetical protein
MSVSLSNIDSLFELNAKRKELQIIVDNFGTIERTYCNPDVNKNTAINMSCSHLKLFFEKKLLEVENELREKGISL